MVAPVFLAVPLPDEIRQALADQVAGLSLPGRIVPPANWHITLRYLGRVDEPTYDRFIYGLGPLQEISSIGLGLQGLGAFPNQRRAAVVWVGVSYGATELGVLSQLAEQAATDAGVAPEERPFHPHLTLSRVRPPEDVSSLIGAEISMKWRCDRVVVYGSRHGPGGATYDPLETLTLRR